MLPPFHIHVHYNKDSSHNYYIMTRQESFQTARNIISGTRRGDFTRRDLKKGALAMGRTAEAVDKASTMRLAFWCHGKSSI